MQAGWKRLDSGDPPTLWARRPRYNRRGMALHDLARRMAAAALAAADAERLVRAALAARPQRWEAALALGKAARAMARGVGDGGALVPGGEARRLLVRTHATQGLLDPAWEELSGGHPLSDRRSLEAGERVLRWLGELPPGEPLLALVSGGASACVEALAGEITLEELTATQRALLGSGLPIHDFNAVRKHLSAFKGGGALRASGARGEWPETVKPGDPEMARVESILVGSVATAIAAAADEARQDGFAVNTGALAGEAAPAARALVARGRALDGGRVALILGGETTVTLGPDPGSGGRYQEVALAGARELASGGGGGRPAAV